MLDMFRMNAFSRKRKARKLPMTCGDAVEALESRALLTEVNIVFNNGSLYLTGDSGADNLTLTFSNTNHVGVMAGGGTTITGNSNGVFLVTGSVSVNLSGGNDSLTVTGTPGSAFGGAITINMGDGNNTTTFTGTMSNSVARKDVSITNGAGNDTINIGGAASTLATRSLIVNNGTGDSDVTVNGLTATGAVSIVNGTTTSTPSVALGATAAVNVAGNLTINQGAGATLYTVNVNNYSVGGNINISNSNGSATALGVPTGTANVTLTKAANATDNGGLLAVTNGNNLHSSITVTGGTFAGAVSLRNGNANAATGNNVINVDGVSSNALTNSTFTNGTAQATNQILLGATTANTFFGIVTASNSSGTGSANTITVSQGTFHNSVSLTNSKGAATATSNAITLGDVAGLTVDGNVTLTNAEGATNSVTVDRLATNLTISALGNLAITNGISQAGGTSVSMGQNTTAGTTIVGGVTISNQASSGNRSVNLRSFTITGTAGLKVTNIGVGTDTTTIGGTAAASLLTTTAGISVSDGTGANTAHFQYLSVGTTLGYSSNSVSPLTDILNLGVVGDLAVTGASTINMGSGASTLNIGTGAGTATLTGGITGNLGLGNDSLTIGIDNTPGKVIGLTPNTFTFNGGEGTDVWTISQLAIGGANPAVAPASAKLLSFEGPNTTNL